MPPPNPAAIDAECAPENRVKPSPDMSTPQTPALVEPNSLSETLLEIAAKHSNAASVDIVASYAAALSDSGRNALMQAIAECYPSNKPAPFGVWQPIETAPRDGTRFLVYYRTLYDTPKGAIRAKTEIAWFKESRLYLSSSQGNEVCNYPNDGATHWMPLPPPPPEKTA